MPDLRPEPELGHFASAHASNNLRLEMLQVFCLSNLSLTIALKKKICFCFLFQHTFKNVLQGTFIGDFFFIHKVNLSLPALFSLFLFKLKMYFEFLKDIR